MRSKPPIFAIQYLEPSPEYADLDPAAARAKLRQVFALFPFRYLIIGWDIPQRLVDACADEAAQANVQLYRWQPLLTGDGHLMPRPEWQTIGLHGEPVPGFQNRAEFTFICPNRPAVHQAVLERLEQLLDQGGYQGFFLDRIRYPSPAPNPMRWLACTCPDCQRLAASEGLDLADAAQRITRLLADSDSLAHVLGLLFGRVIHPKDQPDVAAFVSFLNFRCRSITRMVHAAAELIQARGLTVGLDTFSTTLTRMVGQDMLQLSVGANWVKPMSYCHTLGPAGLPFEFIALCEWIMAQHGWDGARALKLLSDASELPMSQNRSFLRTLGMPSWTLAREMASASASCIRPILAGVELVEIEDVCRLFKSDLEADHHVLHVCPIDGMVFSWDLWHMPIERLQKVASFWQREGIYHF